MTGHRNLKPTAQRMGLQGGDGWFGAGIQGGNQGVQGGLPLWPGLTEHGDIRATNQATTAAHQHNCRHRIVRFRCPQMPDQAAGYTRAHRIHRGVFDYDHGNTTVLFQTGKVRHKLTFFYDKFSSATLAALNAKFKQPQLVFG